MLSFEIVFLSRGGMFVPLGSRAFTDRSARNTTVADVARKVMGDAPIAYVEGAGGTRVAEDQIVALGRNDVGVVLVFHFLQY